MLKEVADGEVEVGEVLVVLFAEWGGVVAAYDEVVAECGFESEADGEVGSVGGVVDAEVWVGCEVGEVVGLEDGHLVDEGVEGEDECLAAEAEVEGVDAEFDGGVVVATAEEPVAEHSSGEVVGADAFEHVALGEELVDDAVLVEGCFAEEGELYAGGVGEGDDVGPEGDVVFPVEVEA